MQTDHDYWGRPEDMEAAGVPRPSYVINATHPGSDMAAQAAAALAAAARVSLPDAGPRGLHIVPFSIQLCSCSCGSRQDALSDLKEAIHVHR